MYSYQTLLLLADARRADLMREAHPQMRPVPPKRKARSLLGIGLCGPLKRGAAGSAWPGQPGPLKGREAKL